MPRKKSKKGNKGNNGNKKMPLGSIGSFAGKSIDNVKSVIDDVGGGVMKQVDKLEGKLGIKKRSFSGFDDMCIASEEQRANRGPIRSLFPGDGPMIKGYPDQANWGSIVCFTIIMCHFVVWCITSYYTSVLLMSDIHDEDYLYSESSIIISWIIDTIVSFFYIYYMYNMCNICRGFLGYIIVGVASAIYGIIRIKFFYDMNVNILAQNAVDDFNSGKRSATSDLGRFGVFD